MICEKNVRKYCCEDISLIENYYEAINSNEMWVCHHRLEIQGDEKYSIRQLIEMRLYYERPANELIFLSKQQHASLHILINKPFQTPWNKGKKGLQICWHKDKPWDKETKEKISNTLKGQTPCNKGVPQPKYKWETSSGEIIIMDMANAHRHHPDWKLIDKLL